MTDMRHNLILFLLSAVSLTACIDEQISEEYSDGQYIFQDIEISNGTSDTKSIMTIDPCEIENLQVFAFSPSTGKIVNYGKNAGASLEGLPVSTYVEGKPSFRWCLPVGVPLDIYAVANIGRIEVPSSVEELLSSEHIRFSYESVDELNGTNAVPMSGILNTTVSPDNSNLTIMMKKVLAKYNIRIAFENLQYTKVHRLTIRNAHKNVKLFAEKEAAASLNDVVKEMDYTTQTDLETLNSGGIITLYLPENMQTTVYGARSVATDWRDISPGNMEKGDLNLCSFLEVSYNYSEFEPNIKECKRNVYLSKSPASDFDVERNKETDIRITIGETAATTFRFTTETYLKVQVGDTVKCEFTYNNLTAEQLTSDSFSTGDPRLTLSDITVNNDGTGHLTVKAEDFSETCESWIQYDCPDPSVAPVRLAVIAEVPLKPNSIYFKYSEAERAKGTFLENPVYADYGDGLVFEITDLCTFSHTNINIAAYKGPGEVLDKGYGYFLSSTNSGYGVSFGNTTGEADITATYKDLTATFHAVTQEEKIWYEAEPAELNLVCGDRINIKLYKKSNTGKPQLFDVKREWVNGIQSSYSEIQAELSPELSVVGSDLYKIEMDNTNPAIFKLFTGSSTAQGVISFKKRMYGTDLATGEGSYQYSVIGGTSIPVRIWHSSLEWGTLKEITITGPDKVLVGDNAAFCAVATFEKNNGKTIEIDVTTRGTWTSTGFAEYEDNGVFLNARTDGSRDRSSTAEVIFEYKGLKARKEVTPYRYSEFEVNTGWDSSDANDTWISSRIVISEKVYSANGLEFSDDDYHYTWEFNGETGERYLEVRRYVPERNSKNKIELMRQSTVNFTIRAGEHFRADGSEYPDRLTLYNIFYNDGFIYNNAVIW